jgi:hypothetical protein
MQKYTRQKRMQMNGGSAEEFIQVRLYRVNEQVDLSLFQNGNGEKLYPKDLERVGTSGAYINKVKFKNTNYKQYALFNYLFKLI